MRRPTLVLLVLAALPTLAQADGLFDTVKQAAQSEAGKAVTNKAIDATKGAVGKAATGKLVKTYPHVGGVDFAGTVLESQHADYKAGDQIGRAHV